MTPSRISSIDLNLSPENFDSPNDVVTSPLNTSSGYSIDLNVLPENVDSSTNVMSSPSNTSFNLNLPSGNVTDSGGNTIATEGNQPFQPHGNKKKNLSYEKKRAIFDMLLNESRDGKLAKGVISKVAKSFSTSSRTVSRIWHDAKCFATTNGVFPNFSSNRFKGVGRKRVQISLEQIKNIPFRRRTNIRSLSKALDVPKSTVHRRIKEGSIRPDSNTVKPNLTDNNKKARLEYCLSMIDEGTLESKPTFVNMHDYIHIDEKWFYITKTSQRYYLHSDETEPYRICKSKRFITKIMFMVAVARPRFDATSNKVFDGKIGIWPFVYKEAAKQNSKTRIAGTLETKSILSITKDVIRSCLIENVLPAIKEKWPRSSSRTIFIQQDNAKPHLDINDGFDIRLCCQPPNSPDMNVLDLGFFRAIDSLQHQEAPETVDGFIEDVTNAFNKFPPEDLNNVFLTLQSCMVEVIRNFGSNNYKIPHLNKQKLARNGQLPDCIERDSQLLIEAKMTLVGGR